MTNLNPFRLSNIQAFSYSIILFIMLLGSSQVSSQYVEIMNEANAKALLAKGGRYEGSSAVDQPPGWWVQYRKVERISLVASDPLTGQKTYYVYFSDVIPTPYNTAGHDNAYLSEDKYWLWVPQGSAPPWAWRAQGAPQWVLKSGYPHFDPDGFQKKRTSTHTVEECTLYPKGAGITFWSGNKQTGVSEAEWYFRLTFDATIPKTLNPGDQIYIPLHADASGQKMNLHLGGELVMYTHGFEEVCDPPTGSYREPAVFAGRAGNGTLLLRSDRNCMLTVPQNPQQEISITLYAAGWGTIVSYVWEKQ
jgi:hypothetical protein